MEDLFSPLMGLYGMEQLPVNMIERIEVVRGGGSSVWFECHWWNRKCDYKI
jgi:hypothetical protein